MKIIQLQAENVKRLLAVDITPVGNLVEITGKNGQGKTSVLDAIWWALAGTKHIQSQPIHDGATEARVHLDLGELKITRTFSAKEDGAFTTKLVVESAEGARFNSPQAVLDALVGELTFDPLEFQRMKPGEQFDALKGFVPGVDFVKLEQLNRGDFERRTDINRQAKALRAQADAIMVPDVVAAPVDETKLTADLERAGQFNSDLSLRRERRAQADAQLLALREGIQKMRVVLEEEEARADGLAKQIEAAEPLPEPRDTGAIRQAIADSREANEAAGAAKRKAGLITEAETLEAQSKELTEAMEARDTAKTKAIAEADMPVKGIEFGADARGEGIVLLNGHPFDQASDAEQLRASIAIAGAMNTKLRVVRVRDGSLLDEDAMAFLTGWAEEHDLQIWIERVDSSGRVGFVIENGQVVSQPEEEALG